MPCDYSLYPANWLVLRRAILVRALGECEFCGARNKRHHPLTGSQVVLTIAHLDHDTTHNHPENLRALCQRCHFAWDKTAPQDPQEQEGKSMSMNEREIHGDPTR